MKSLFFALLLCVCSILQAQKNTPASLYESNNNFEIYQDLLKTPRPYASFLLGISGPESSYGGIAGFQQVGYARTGIFLGVEGGYPLYKNIGVSGSLFFYANRLKQKDYLESLHERIPLDITGELTTQKWRNTVVGVGPYITFLEKYVGLDLRMLLGFSVSRAPATSFEGVFQETPITDVRTGDRGVSPAIVLGLTLSTPIPQLLHWRAIVKAEYIGAAPKLKIDHLTQAATYQLNDHHVYRQSVSIFAFSVGIRYEFGYGGLGMERIW